MSASFSRSIRTMQKETSGRFIGVLLVIILLLVGWLVWMFMIQVPVYVVAETAELTSEVAAVANFQADKFLLIKPGQTALMRLDAFPWNEYGTVNAIVTRVDGELQDGVFQVDLRLEPSSNAVIPLQSGLIGLVEIQVEQVTPVELLLRTTGRRIASETLKADSSTN